MKSAKLTFQAVLVAVFIAFIAASLVFESVELSWAIVAVAFVYSLRLVAVHGRSWWKGRPSKVARRERFMLFLVSLMVMFLITGTALYLWAFQCQGEDTLNEPEGKRFFFINAEYLLRALVCSFQLFTANIDSNVLDGISEHIYIKGLISLQAVLSFSCTVAVLISLAYARVKAFIKLHRQTTIDDTHNRLFVFFGINEPSRLLAKSINERHDGRSLILFVENSHVDEENSGGWDNIVGMFTHRRQTFADADELDARVTFTETRLFDIDLEDLQQDKTGMKDVLKETNLIKLRELIQQLKEHRNGAELHVFFLSDNEDDNIQAVSILAQDTTINSVNGCIKQKFYCHARQNGLNRVIEDIAVKRGMEVRIIDSSHLSIDLLKADSSHHPVRLVETDPDEPTTVSSDFCSLIVGFDEAGQDALKFLYEFGAFVSNEGTPDKEVRSPFHCIVTDKRMDQLQGVFATFAPAAIAQKNPDASPLIRFEQCDCTSSEFFDRIVNQSLRQKLNYVVITVGNDELGMLLAIRLLNHIRRDREDLRRLRIYVRSYRPEREAYMQKIANYYNEGYNQDCEKSKRKELKTDAIIIPFGQSEKIYTYDMIIREDLIEKGKTFQRRYCEIKGEREFWDLRRELLTGAKRKDKQTKAIHDVPIGQRKVSLNDMRALRRKESQDMANALHADTKLYLLRQALGSDTDWAAFIDNYFDASGQPKCEGAYDTIRYPYLSVRQNKAIRNLARLEHLRWNASHEMLGYTRGDADLHNCNERTRQHNCLRPWEELDDEGRAVSRLEGWTADYKSFDFCVVDVSIWLKMQR